MDCILWLHQTHRLFINYAPLTNLTLYSYKKEGIYMDHKKCGFKFTNV